MPFTESSACGPGKMMKTIDGRDKLRGGYYTPKDLADFLVGWAVRTGKETLLEPSCGDGSFLAAIRRKAATCAGISEKNVTAVELDRHEAKMAARYGYPVINGDFFAYYRQHIEGIRKFDVILGNPPFIRYQNFDEKYRAVAFSLMKDHGFHPNRLTNIWLPFLVLACEALSGHGRIAMVVPAELFQVDYAAEARKYLSEHFDSLTLVTFKKLVFEGIQQEIFLLLGEKSSPHKGIRVVELEGREGLARADAGWLKNTEAKNLDHSKDKWVKYYLTAQELALLDRLNSDARISDATTLYEVNVGLVSGENAFFITDWGTVVRRGLQKETQAIISRADQVKGVRLSEQDYQQLKLGGKRVSLFLPDDAPLAMLRRNAREYIAWGERMGFHLNYKCRIRRRWYVVPTSWRADAFLIRQANLYPKMILNHVGALVTDTLHKVRFHEGVDGNAVTSAFLNLYTLALSETLGRSYGGGVLTFEPGEMRRMRIPMMGAEKLDIQKIDDLQRSGNHKEILEYTSKLLLLDGLGLDQRDVSLLYSIWCKMRDRRLSRKCYG